MRLGGASEKKIERQTEEINAEKEAGKKLAAEQEGPIQALAESLRSKAGKDKSSLARTQTDNKNSGSQPREESVKINIKRPVLAKKSAESETVKVKSSSQKTTRKTGKGSKVIKPKVAVEDFESNEEESVDEEVTAPVKK